MKQLIPEVKNLTFFLQIKVSCSYIIINKDTKLVIRFYWSLYTLLKNKTSISRNLFAKYTCRNFLLNVIFFKCTKFTEESLILLPVQETFFLINVTVIYTVNTLFYSVTNKMIPN